MTNVKLLNLIKMANQIADNICHQDTSSEAIAKLANHLTLFWAKSMKADILAYYREDGSQLSEPVKKALEQI